MASDFLDAPRAFEGRTLTLEDRRFDYPERRYLTLGLIDGVPVAIVHTETSIEIRVISFRKATSREERIFFESL